MYHILQMRRSLSILLMLVFGLGPLTLALQQNDDASLPACCRRHGAHHCAMSGETGSQRPNPQAPAFKAPSRCPLFPLHGNANPSRMAAVLPVLQHAATPVFKTPLRLLYSADPPAIHLDAYGLRGPPLTS